MDFCSHLIDAAAKAIGIFWLNSLSAERQKTKIFDKCHVKLLNICLIEIVGAHASDDILRGKATL